MEKTSKIKSVSSKFSEKSNKWYYDIEMENWDKWTIWHNNENAYQVWQELKYKLTLKKDSTDKYRMNEVKDKKRWGGQRDYKIDFITKALELAVMKPGWAWSVISAFNEYYDLMEKKYLSVKQTN